MKKVLLLFTLLSISSTAKSQDQLENSGFDDWTVTTLYNKPNTWRTSLEASGYRKSDPVAIGIYQPASHLNSAMRLATAKIGNDTVPAFINYNGTTGIPFTLSADSLIFDALVHQIDNDSAKVTLMMISGGLPVYMGSFKLGGTQNAWKRFAFKINEANATPEKLILEFRSSGNDIWANRRPGAWFAIDNIRFADGNSISSPTPNASFEEWTAQTIEEPKAWQTLLLDTYGLDKCASKTTTTQQGSGALELKSILVGGTALGSMATYGTWKENLNTFKGKPFTAKPANFTGYYKYAPSGSDTAHVFLQFFKNGVEIAKADKKLYNNVSAFTEFTVPLNLTETPDSLLAMLYSGANANSKVTFDNFKFTGGNVGLDTQDESKNKISLFPNPTNTDCELKVFISTPSMVSYRIVNSLGQTVDSREGKELQCGDYNFHLKTSELQAGVYYLSTQIDNQVYTKKLILK